VEKPFHPSMSGSSHDLSHSVTARLQVSKKDKGVVAESRVWPRNMMSQV